jgi:hypothetical protein
VQGYHLGRPMPVADLAGWMDGRPIGQAAEGRGPTVPARGPLRPVLDLR